jgi:hypothetical protein
MDSEPSGDSSSGWAGRTLLYFPALLLVVYLSGFALLSFFPASVKAAAAIGLSSDRLRIIYRPILKFIER